MNEKLSAIEQRFEEITNALYDPETAADVTRYTALIKEQKQLSPLIEAWRAYKRARADAEDSRRAADEAGEDREFRALCMEEAAAAEKKVRTANSSCACCFSQRTRTRTEM